jgi:hypothetical protein
MKDLRGLKYFLGIEVAMVYTCHNISIYWIYYLKLVCWNVNQ